MHTMKKLFGGKKDPNDSVHTNTATGEKIEPERRRTSIFRQILNPGGDKYDEQRLGPPATVASIKPEGETNPGANTVAHDAILRTDTSEHNREKESKHGVLRQILNPHGDKYDAEGYGTTAHVVGSMSEPPPPPPPEGGASRSDAIQRA